MFKDILKQLTPHFTDTCPFDPKPKANAQVQWVKMRLVCEVAFQEWTSDCKLRVPAFLGFKGGQGANRSGEELMVARASIFAPKARPTPFRAGALASFHAARRPKEHHLETTPNYLFPLVGAPCMILR